MFHVKQPGQAIDKQTKRCSTWNVLRWATHFLGNLKKGSGFHVEQRGVARGLKARVEGTGKVLHKKEVVCIIIHTAQSNLRILLVQQGLPVCGRGKVHV